MLIIDHWRERERDNASGVLVAVRERTAACELTNCFERANEVLKRTKTQGSNDDNGKSNSKNNNNNNSSDEEHIENRHRLVAAAWPIISPQAYRSVYEYGREKRIRVARV